MLTLARASASASAAPPAPPSRLASLMPHGPRHVRVPASTPHLRRHADGDRIAQPLLSPVALVVRALSLSLVCAWRACVHVCLSIARCMSD
jgi:hypothetical protein